MAKQYFSPRNLKFLLYETHDAEELLQYERFAHMDKETMDMMLAKKRSTDRKKWLEIEGDLAQIP